MVCLGYSAPGTHTANRFVGLSSRDPAFLHQQQVRHGPSPLPFSFSSLSLPLFSLKSPSNCSVFPTGVRPVRKVAHQIICSWSLGTAVALKRYSEVEKEWGGNFCCLKVYFVSAFVNQLCLLGTYSIFWDAALKVFNTIYIPGKIFSVSHCYWACLSTCSVTTVTFRGLWFCKCGLM